MMLAVCSRELITCQSWNGCRLALNISTSQPPEWKMTVSAAYIQISIELKIERKVWNQEYFSYSTHLLSLSLWCSGIYNGAYIWTVVYAGLVIRIHSDSLCLWHIQNSGGWLWHIEIYYYYLYLVNGRIKVVYIIVQHLNRSVK